MMDEYIAYTPWFAWYPVKIISYSIEGRKERWMWWTWVLRDASQNPVSYWFLEDR